MDGQTEGPEDDLIGDPPAPSSAVDPPEPRRGFSPEFDVDGLSFPGVPRLELEELLGQLTEKAQGVLTAQGRLRALLRANAVVAGELNLHVVLRHIVTAARDLVGARYAALGVIGRDGSLEEFVHVGMDTATVARIGELPRGGGILGLLISHPDPLRLHELGAHPVAAGFPSNHPPMGSFLGVPIRIRDHVFGNLYLTESRNGEFSVEDEQLVTSLAASAGIAIHNARLFDESEQRRHWQAVSTEATQQLFAGGGDAPLEVVLTHAMKGAAGDLALLGLMVGDDQVRVEAAVGSFAAELAGGVLLMEESVAATVLREGKPILVTDYHPMSATTSALAGNIGSLIIAPLLSGDHVTGALAVGRIVGARTFTDADLDQLVGYANHAGIALELDTARANRDSMLMLQEHERIAADLHDHVVQELFATGMGLQGMVSLLTDTEHQARMLGYVDALDATIRRIRSTIFQLNRPQTTYGSDALRTRLMTVLEDENAALGFRAHIEFSGLIDLTPPTMADDVVAVVREALSNVARHAHASSVTIRAVLVDTSLSIDITDDGQGMGNTSRSSGLANLRKRAQRYGGTLTVDTPDAGGTRLRWIATIPAKQP